ncbi:RING-box protein hrt1 [Exophiala xenobiotica]|uniref:RING-box protein hrt1 n=1 Tax=Vermiconidia calcicola TaxID=1690605 RepID=A0AAV9QIN3_9PEZI|nr:RING-box protein hrt1 [Exophiala xenobiotica]KAK5539142.1 RING-box protein hrt1 [Chaetothyriales sp. CCFEE 6169]KAK5542500.1 RING-box protein hrt1 [Vermiconidia calcicola]KAK5257914.1 RING-box protein hrt1 [Exophiala xenobiotica]KAK5298881.1 RING-box protein hrt1 [Exophiala xenobiotica]
MADVEMADANAATEQSKSKAPVKASKSGAAEGGDTKKRFEVKKASNVKQIKVLLPQRNVLSLGESATTPSTSTAFHDG